MIGLDLACCCEREPSSKKVQVWCCVLSFGLSFGVFEILSGENGFVKCMRVGVVVW